MLGWTVTIQDYEGPNAAFIAGRLEGRGVLDGIRATLKFPQLGLNSPKIAIWVSVLLRIIKQSLISFACRVTREAVLLPDGVRNGPRLARALLSMAQTAAALQPTYAPELNLIGVAQGGTPANLTATAEFIVG